MKSKKIVISCSNAASLINFRGRLIATLVKDNDVFVITPTIHDLLVKEELLERGVKIFETSLNRNSISISKDLRYLFQLFKILRKVKPDIFFAYTFKPIIFGTVVATLCNVKNINGMLTGLGYSFTENASRSSRIIIQSMLRFSLRFNRNLKIIFQNKDDYQELLKKKIISSKSRAFVVDGSGVDLSHFEFSVPDVSNITFLMMSRLIKSKGINEFVEAASIIKAKHPRVRFVLAGGYTKGETDSVDQDVYEKIIDGSIIEYEGWVTDIRPYIKNSTTVVLPSYYREGIPRSLLEALAMGRPIITTDMIGCKETVCHEPDQINGFAIPIKDSSELASKMEYLISNPQMIKEMGRNGRLIAESKFDVEKVNKRMIEIFNSDGVPIDIHKINYKQSIL